MFIDIEFQQLRCDGGRAQPYLWMELLQIDDDTLAPNGPLVAAVDHRPLFDAQVMVREEMKAGDSAPIPGELARLGARFRAGLMRRDLILVALLWDHRGTPYVAVDAGYSAFLSELRDAVADNLLALSTTTGPDNDSIIQVIKQRVRDKVEAAITDKISWLQEIGIFVGLEDTDRLIDSTFKRFEDADFTQLNIPTPFTLTFHDSGDDFKLDAQQFEIAYTCEDELIQVRSLQQDIATMQGALRQLGHAHGGEPRPEDEQKMQQVEQHLRAAQAKLYSAQDAYKQCQRLHEKVSGEG